MIDEQLYYIAKQKDRSIAPIFYFIYKVYCDFARSESECFTVNIMVLLNTLKYERSCGYR